MDKDTPVLEFGRGSTNDALTEILREGAKKLLLAAVEEELEHFLRGNAEQRLPDGRAAVVRNGYLPERQIQTGIGNLTVRVPKVRDRSGSGVKFNSALLPPYLKRTKSVEELLPWLYLKGVSTGDFQEALQSILGHTAQGLSANTICRLKSNWLTEYKDWQKRDLSDKRYVYWWADGIYSNVRMDDKLCLLVIIGATEDGRKELIAVEDGFRESTDSWTAVFADLCSRGLKEGPSLATGDGALGFWKALTQIFPKTRHQRCCVAVHLNAQEFLPIQL